MPALDSHQRKLTLAGVDAVCRRLDQLLLYGSLYTEERQALMHAVNSIEAAFGAHLPHWRERYDKSRLPEC
jgi:hypothetical protein